MARRPRSSLLVEVLTKLGEARIYERFIPTPRGEGEVYGLWERLRNCTRITVNPVHHTVDTVCHEILHELRPAWSERYVRNRTSWLIRQLSAEQVQQVYAEYQKRVRRQVRKKRLRGVVAQNTDDTRLSPEVAPFGVPPVAPSPDPGSCARPKTGRQLPLPLGDEDGT